LKLEDEMSEEKASKTKAILERIEKERGFVRLWPKLLAERDPEFMECLHNVTTHALHKREHLPRKMKEIILICLNAFDYYEYGFRIHVRSALKAGVTEDELLDALEVVGVLEVHSLTSMLPVLVEEVEKFQKETGTASRA
jgi:alkylhydroperoxidase/carboxymuconolactone decarboxylase family protein YurZ